MNSESSDQIEIKILSLAKQGFSRLEFKRRVSELLLGALECTAVDIYIEDHATGCTWHSEKESGLEFSFTKYDDSSKTTKKYAELAGKSILQNGELFHSKEGNTGSVAAYLPIDRQRTGLLVFIRPGRRQGPVFTTKEEGLILKISNIFAAAVSYRNTQAALRERIKELSCLYEISRIMQKNSESLDDTLQETVKIIPQAFQYQDIASCRIRLGDREYLSEPINNPEYSLKSPFSVFATDGGYVEVIYTAKKLDFEEEPFLREEQHLLDSIAKQISLLIEDFWAAEDRKKLEHQLRHADRLATIGQLAAGVAHEINEPLANILGFSELIKKDPGLSSQSKSDLEKIIKASIFARETVKKLLVFARQINPARKEVDVNEIITEGLRFFESRCGKEGIRMQTDLAPGLPPISADPSQLNQIMVNLTVNAIQAMPDGGILRISTQYDENDIVITVEDTGCGMDENTKDQIFVPFFTTKDIGEGTGLGLSVVHGIISAYNGRIEVNSRIGEGSSFEVYLPRKETIG